MSPRRYQPRPEGGTSNVRLTLPTRQVAELDRIAERRNITFSYLMTEIADEWLRKQPRFDQEVA